MNYICDDRYIQNLIDSKKADVATIESKIINIINKINDSLNDVHEKAFACTECSHFGFKCTEIVPISNILLFNNNSKGDISINTDKTDMEGDSENTIWLPDAELAVGEQTRFETYSKVGAVKKFIPDKITTEDAIWGISSIKGAGKTFLLQVKRVKVSPKYFTIPLVNKPSADNKWATETISNITNNDIFDCSIDELTNLWRYSIICHVVLSYSTSLKKSSGKNAKSRYSDLVNYIEKNVSDTFTKSILTNELNLSLDRIMTRIVWESNWKEMIKENYIHLRICADYVIELLLNQKSNRKTGFALFLDKIDQFIDPPEAEDPPDECVGCEYGDNFEKCDNDKKSEKFCKYFCKEMCCYTCPTFGDVYAGTKTRTASSKNNKMFAHVNYWQYFQLALINAAYKLKLDFNGKIKVFFTVREEALNCEDNIFHDRKAKVFGIFERIYYSRSDQKTIFYESIQNEQNLSMLFDPNFKFEDTEYAFLGVNSLCHPYVLGQKETVFDSIYRHSFDRARDIQHFGRALSQKVNAFKEIKNPKEREEEVKKVIENTAANLLIQERGLPSYYEEKMDIMPRHWRDRQHFLNFIQMIDRNLLFSEDIVEICRKINNITDKECCDGKDCNLKGCIRHPFSFLYKMGLLGIVQYNENNEGNEIQKFVNSNEITYFHEADELYIDPRSCYIIHPALTKAIEALKNTNIHHFKGFILGKSLPVSKAFLVKLLNDKKNLSKTDFDEKYYS